MALAEVVEASMAIIRANGSGNGDGMASGNGIVGGEGMYCSDVLQGTSGTSRDVPVVGFESLSGLKMS